jgi:hypothetical protein
MILFQHNYMTLFTTQQTVHLGKAMNALFAMKCVVVLSTLIVISTHTYCPLNPQTHCHLDR